MAFASHEFEFNGKPVTVRVPAASGADQMLGILAEELPEAAEEMRDLLRYLRSPKFRDDPTVQVDDILRRTVRMVRLLMPAAPSEG